MRLPVAPLCVVLIGLSGCGSPTGDSTVSALITYTVHYPRNHLMFHAPMTEDVARLTAAAQEWAIGNFFRLVFILASAVAASLGLKAALLENPKT